ncbi:serine protease inhibitor 28Dc [Eurosta solidaginis]|uniref:serine protease inhibitor 28Dc n=1 Tax=Eurosta solidaginis TaxID=178769 RepID=UPI0035305A58
MISLRSSILAVCLQTCIFAYIFGENGITMADDTSAGTPAGGAGTADIVAASVLNFAQDVGLLLNENLHLGKTTIFSPVSIMSSMALLLLGSRGKNYEDLRHIFRLDVPPLRDAFNAFHTEFSAMMQEMQNNSVALQSRNRDNWRNTNVAFNIRTTPKVGDVPGEAMGNVIKIVNGLFVKNGYELNPKYRDIINSIYKCDITSLDFNTPKSRDYINDWVYKSTFGKIAGIITDNISADTNAIIASALYFKGYWENPFLSGATIIDNFYPDGIKNPAIKVKMMATAGAYPYYYASEYDCKIIGLPYVNNFTTMYVIQPNNSSRDKLRNLLKTLDAEKIEGMIAKMIYQNAIFTFPKMHLTQNINMKSVFRALGVNGIFVPPPVIDLSSKVLRRTQRGVIFPFEKSAGAPHIPTLNLLERWSLDRNRSSNLLSDLFVGDIVHKVDFVVDENGTEGAAATVTYLKRSGGNVLFRADTPFLLLVRHDPTKLPLFYGIINFPLPHFI